MTIIWIDGDACPKSVKEIIYKAANRTKIECRLVANQLMRVPPWPMIKTMVVEQGFDKADEVIIESIVQGDIVITSDLALADSCLSKQAHAMSPRGDLFNLNTIKQKLAMRDFNDQMRSTGLYPRGLNSLTPKDINLFANQLDRLLVKAKKKS